MVSAGISNTIINSVDSGSKVSKSAKSKSPEADFTKVLEKQTDMNASIKNGDEKSGKLAENDEMKEIIQKHFGSKENEQITTVDEPEETVEEMAAAVFVNIVNVVADNLNLEPEKVIQAVEDLDYEAGDMLDTNVINDVVKELTGMENIMDILINKELSDTIKNIYAEIGEVQEVFEKDFGISREQLLDMLDNVDMASVTDEAVEIIDENVVEDVAVMEDSESDYPNNTKSDIRESVNSIVQNNPETLSDNNVTEVKDTNDDYSEVRLENDTQDKSYITDNGNADNGSKDSDSKSSDNNNNSETIVSETVSRKTTVSETSTHEASGSGHEVFNLLSDIKEIVADKIAGEDNGLADRIVRQITDDIRMYARQDTTALEIQLEPETLGKVNLTVASKSGVVTAQLVVQNEVAKEAVESQMATLKESMNEQGIKIEAIEVTLASKEFEESLDKHKDTSEQNEQKHKKHFTNEELAEINGTAVSDEDIKEEIMKEMGNTVSYIA